MCSKAIELKNVVIICASDDIAETIELYNLINSSISDEPLGLTDSEKSTDSTSESSDSDSDNSQESRSTSNCSSSSLSSATPQFILTTSIPIELKTFILETEKWRRQWMQCRNANSGNCSE